MLSKITYSQIEFIKIRMNCNFEINFTNYNFIQKAVFSYYTRDAKSNVRTTYPCKNYNSANTFDNNGFTENYYLADVVSFSDYYPFGMLMPNRHGQTDSYRHSFQNQEEDNEVYGSKGTYINYKFRGADTRIGRFFATDPLEAQYTWNSPYAFSENRVIDGVELEGLEWAPYNSDGNRLDINAEGYNFDQASEYRWEGFIDMGYEAGGSTYRNYEDIPIMMQQSAKSVETSAPGTVVDGQVNSTDQYGREIATYYGTNQYNGPMKSISLRAPWMAGARSHNGLTEGNNATIQGMIDGMNTDYGYPDAEGKSPLNSDAEEWCGVFVYNCLINAGISVNNPNGGGYMAPSKTEFYRDSWVEGRVIDKPVYGAIVRFSHSHVAFVVSYTKTHVTYIGGNQQPLPALDDGRGTEVNTTTRRRSTVSFYAIPVNYTPSPKD